MTSWIDLFSFLTISFLFVGTILTVIFIMNRISAAAQNTKKSLQNRGISISHKGVSVKTSKRFDREHYVDATQRGVMKAVGASTVRFSTMDNSEPNSKSRSLTNLTTSLS